MTSLGKLIKLLKGYDVIMKSTGIVRKMDELGRIVIPMELRMTMGIEIKDPIEILVGDDECIALKKYQPSCVFCNETANTEYFKGKLVCGACRREMAEL